MNTWNAGQILSVVRTRNKMDINYLGDDETAQNQALFQFLNVALWKLARLAYNTETSDTVTISQDGPVTFTKGNTAISNMFEPLRMVKMENGRPVAEHPKRYSILAPIGWWCEAPNQPIDVVGATGTYALTYIRYPRQITQAGDPVDITEQAYGALIDEISTQIKLTKNYYEEAAAVDAKAKQAYPGITQSAISARGPSSGGQPPSYDDVKQARGG